MTKGIYNRKTIYIMLVVVLCLVGVVAFLVMGDKEGDDGINSDDGVDSQTLSIEESNKLLINSRLDIDLFPLGGCFGYLNAFNSKPVYVVIAKNSEGGDEVEVLCRFDDMFTLYEKGPDTAQYTYDSAGMLANNWNRDFYNYGDVDENNRIRSIAVSRHGSVIGKSSLDYDKKGRLIGIQYQDHRYDAKESITYQYDSNNRVKNIKRVKYNIVTVISINYIDDSRIDSVVFEITDTDYSSTDYSSRIMLKGTMRYNLDGSIDEMILTQSPDLTQFAVPKLPYIYEYIYQDEYEQLIQGVS